MKKEIHGVKKSIFINAGTVPTSYVHLKICASFIKDFLNLYTSSGHQVFPVLRSGNDGVLKTKLVPDIHEGHTG